MSDVNRARMSPSVVLGDACESLRTHVTEAEEYAFKRGIPDCVAGVDGQDDALASQGVMEITGDGLRNLKSTMSMLRVTLDAQ